MENNSSLVQMYVDVDDRKKALLTQQDVYEIEQYILEQICTNVEKQGHPQLRGHVFSEIEGALIIKSHVDSVSWLEKVIRSYQKKALRIRNLKDVPQYNAEVQASVPPLDIILELLEAQNVGLVTSGWKFLSTSDTTLYNGRKGWSVTLLIDDPGREVLERNNLKLFLGIATITFQRLHKVKRCETTGKLQRVVNQTVPSKSPFGSYSEFPYTTKNPIFGFGSQGQP